MNDKEEIKNCYLKMINAMISKDEKLLNKVLDDKFSLTHISGAHQTKTEFIDEILDGTLNYFEVNHKAIDISLKDNKAFLKGKSILRAAVYGGMERDWPLNFELKLEKNDDIWRITESNVNSF